jgi:hypothetical protein
MENTQLEFDVSFDKFIYSTGIKVIQGRFSSALKLLMDIQDKPFYEWSQPVLSEDYSEVLYEIKRLGIIPEITLVLDEELGSKITTLKEYIELKIPNKKKHVKGLRFKISDSYLANILCLGRDFTGSSSRNTRLNFKSSYSYRLDFLLLSIKKVQKNPSLNRFTFEEIQKKFGTSYKTYAEFKKNVLVPSIKDINNVTGMTVELDETRKSESKNSPLLYLSFIIKEKDSVEDIDIEKIARYIALRQMYHSTEKIKVLSAYIKYISRNIRESNKDIVFGEKTIPEWIVEAKEMMEIEESLYRTMELNIGLLKEESIKYDSNRMCLVKNLAVKNEDSDIDANPTKSEYIYYRDQKINNPKLSLVYLEKLARENTSINQFSILDFLPFYFAIPSGWAAINNADDYLTYEKLIKDAIKSNKIKYFKFENQDSSTNDYFNKCIINNNFREISTELSEIILNIE